MNEELAERLVGLSTLSGVALRAEWRRVYRTAPPSFTPDLLARGIAHALQTKALGGLDRKIEAELLKFGLRGETSERGDTPAIKPGTRLIRAWNGVTHIVVVTDRGFTYNGEDYPSLTAIAKVITGTQWSGPRFFGLKRRVGHG